ncbi:30S ribosomal protein S3 [Candidatus Babela massiliensis]|uniref:Small ribosomal subunit protein uS3 n=1 Tax=Candidatus Babela massiliensis TaxID=673862 RepID=V6DFZ5_9BACT|nr:30S ribosomal protein S3 [Candidatus Babela massiliensis]CDK30507.1 Ribosomal protein S3 [Candidatus Babela massiliensis]
MGQKVNPIGFRLGVYRSWPSRWFARRENYSKLLLEDIKIRNFIEKNLANAEISKVEIERAGDNNLKVIVYSARPGIVIGRKGQEIDTLRRDLSKLINKANVEVSVQEVKQPELDATIIAKSISEQLEKRGSFKKAMKRAALDVMKSGAKGVKIRCAGRLGGAEIARDEWIRVGSTPLHTLRSDIDYGFVEAHTTYGVIGIKVWICRGEFKIT